MIFRYVITEINKRLYKNLSRCVDVFVRLDCWKLIYVITAWFPTHEGPPGQGTPSPRLKNVRLHITFESTLNAR